MANEVTELKLTSSLGEFNFGDYDLPLISRSVAYSAKTPGQPLARRKINVTLNGFFLGDDHEEVMSQYIALKDILSLNKLTWFYRIPQFDGDGNFTKWIDIADGPVYLTALNEPEEWKQYDGNYSISFYYFEKLTPNNPFTVTFINNSGTITFNPIPTWVHKIKKTRKVPGDGVSPSGAKIGSTGSITLNGHIVDTTLNINTGPKESDETALWSSITSMQTILELDKAGVTGTLNYGPFSKAVYIESFSISEGVLQNSIDYSITMKYYTESIIELSAKVRFSRIHYNPKITERPACGDRLIKFGNISGQDVGYNLKIKAESLSAARTLLATEYATLLIASGIEMPGGSEVWNYDDNSVTLNVNRFHNAWVLGNI